MILLDTNVVSELLRKADRGLAGRVLAFDAAAAAHYAQIAAARERSGRPISMADAQIAAICRTWSARLVTRNVEDFVGTGVGVIDPWALPVG